MCIRAKASSCRCRRWRISNVRSAPSTISHLGQVPSVTVSFNLAPGVSLSQAVERIDGGGRETQDARDDHRLVPGHGAGIPVVDLEHGIAAAVRSVRDLSRARNSLREFHPSADDPVRRAHRRVRRAAHAAHLPHRSESVFGGRPDHADRHREEERDHDDRLRARKAARRRIRRKRRFSMRASCVSVRS